jgi:hypothetical protein
MNRFYENFKIDTGLKGQALNNTNAIGRYFSMKGHKRALFVLVGGAMAVSKTTKIEVFEAKDAAGTDAQAITDLAAIITANIKATEATLTLASVVATDVVTINGVALTAVADGSEDHDAKIFSVKTTNATCATELAACINSNFSDVVAVAVDAVVTLKAVDPGEAYVTASTPDSTITIATTQALAYAEIDEEDLSTDYAYVAAKVTTTANTVVAAALLREPDYIPPALFVAAGDALTI